MTSVAEAHKCHNGNNEKLNKMSDKSEQCRWMGETKTKANEWKSKRAENRENIHERAR